MENRNVLPFKGRDEKGEDVEVLFDRDQHDFVIHLRQRHSHGLHRDFESDYGKCYRSVCQGPR